MHGTSVPKSILLFVMCSSLLCQSIFCQRRAEQEVDITKCWSYPLGELDADQLAADESRIFVGLDGAVIQALSLDGAKIWSSEFGGEITSNIIVTDNSLFFTTSTAASDAEKATATRLRWVSKETGITNWTSAMPDVGRYYLATVNGSVIAVSQSGTIQSIDPKNGDVKWTRQIVKGLAAEPSFTTDKVIIASTSNQILGISLTTGEVNFSRKPSAGVTALSALANAEFVVGDERGTVSVLNGGDRPIWTFKTGAAISKILTIADNVLVASRDNFVYFLAGRNGGRIWKRRLAGRVGQIAKVNDTYALIASLEERGALLTGLSNGKAAGRIIFEDDESLAAPPVVTKDVVLVVTNSAAYSYSLNRCRQEKIKAAPSQ